jgi:hypothetical protein
MWCRRALVLGSISFARSYRVIGQRWTTRRVRVHKAAKLLGHVIPESVIDRVARRAARTDPWCFQRTASPRQSALGARFGGTVREFQRLKTALSTVCANNRRNAAEVAEVVAAYQEATSGLWRTV